MKYYIKCPRCKKISGISKKMHASWTCPNCHNSIVPKENKVMNQFRAKIILKKA